MKPAPFDYIRADTLEEVISVLGEVEGAKILAGGQSLIPLMNMRLARPSAVISLRGIKGLQGIECRDGKLAVGAMAPQARLLSYAKQHDEWALLHEGMMYIGHPQTRSAGTVGGSLAHADPSAELPMLLEVYGGSVEVLGLLGNRFIEAAEFFQFPFTTTLAPDELLIASHWPIPKVNTGFRFKEQARRRGDFAMAALACLLTVDPVSQRLISGRLGVAGGGPTPLTLDLPSHLSGQVLTEDGTQHWLELLDAKLDPPDDLEASPEMRRSVIAALGRDVIQEAARRAIGGQK